MMTLLAWTGFLIVVAVVLAAMLGFIGNLVFTVANVMEVVT